MSHHRALLSIAALALLLASCSTNDAGSPMVGSDTDEHGCKASAGYQWSQLRSECIRIFESGIRLDPQAPDLDPAASAFVVFKSDTDQAQAEVFLPGQDTSALLPQVSGDEAGRWENADLSLTRSQEQYALADASGQLLYQGPAAR